MAAGRDARDWSELPLDALTFIFTKLGPLDVLMGAGFVCHSWLDAAEERSLWRHLDMSSNNNIVKEKCRLGEMDVLCAMVKKAIDRSGGQLEVFIGEWFVDGDFLNYIGDRAPSLKILHLISCFFHKNEGFVEAINKFHLLEELKLSLCENICDRTSYEAVGKACQNLKIFKVEKSWFNLHYVKCKRGYYYDEGDAFGIATMHGLRYLKIISSGLNNKELDAILDNCPHLKFLDLCYCPEVDMDTTMRAKCAGVKVSVCPHVSM